MQIVIELTEQQQRRLTAVRTGIDEPWAKTVSDAIDIALDHYYLMLQNRLLCARLTKAGVNVSAEGLLDLLAERDRCDG